MISEEEDPNRVSSADVLLEQVFLFSQNKILIKEKAKDTVGKE
jgi:hypothetical protein